MLFCCCRSFGLVYAGITPLNTNNISNEQTDGSLSISLINKHVYVACISVVMYVIVIASDAIYSID